MSRIANKLPSRAMVVAIVACVLAVAGTASAATGSFGLGIFNQKARGKIVGVGNITRNQTSNFLSAGQTGTFSAPCAPGTTPLGGGARVSTGAQPIEGLVDSFPSPSGWSATVFNSGTESHTVFVYVICGRANDVRGTVSRVK
jgi:hypothetical protein